MKTSGSKRYVVRSADVMGYSPAGSEEAFVSRMLIDKTSVGSQNLIVNEFTLQAGQNSYKGQHPCPFDEVYYVVKGKAFLIVGNDNPHRYLIEQGDIAYIPCETDHCLENPYEEDLILLTMMANQPTTGVNTLYDARIGEWGTSFKLKPGSEEMKNLNDN